MQENYSGGRYVVPSIEEHSNNGVKVTDPYSKLFESRIIFLAAPIDGTSASDIVAQLLALDHIDSSQDITIYVNSPGGNITDVSMIIDAINLISSDVAVVCLGQASSVAALLIAAGAKGKRSALPHSRIMLHQPSTLGSARNQASDLEIYGIQLQESKDWMTSFLSEQTGQSVEKISKDIVREKYLNSEGALEYGLIDYIQNKN